MTRKETVQPAPSVWPLRIAASGIFLAEVVVLPGAASPFRLPKDTIVLAAISLALALATFGAARRKTLVLASGRLTLILLALPVLQAISSAWSANPLRAMESAAISLIWVLGILWLATLEPRSRLRLATVAATGVIVSAAVMVLQIGGVQIFNLGVQFATGRLSLTGLTGNPADLAMAAVLLLPFFLARMDESSITRGRFVLVTALSLATVLTRSLTGLAALALLVLVWLIQQKSRKLWARMAVVGAAVLALALAAGLGPRLMKAIEQAQKGQWYALFTNRGDGWTAASEMVRSHPISGVGAANYDHLYYPSRLDWLARQGGVGRRSELASHFNWAHNDPLQLAAELGIIGVLWLTAVLVALASIRTRAGPLLALSLAAFTPFALLHYPTHLAVGLIPVSVILAEIIGTTETTRTIAFVRGPVPIVALVVIAAIVSVGWQLRRTAADGWVGSVETILAISQQAPPDAAARQTASLEAAILARIDTMPRHAPTLWRSVGRARLLRKDYWSAESAFRTAYAGWPHEDADFYLGLALVSQGRRTDGLRHLGRVCRTNPTLVQLIPDESLRREVQEMLRAYRSQ